jgi:hypothetical protein
MGLLQEPAGYVDGGSLYQALSCSPVKAVDPSGLTVLWVMINAFSAPTTQPGRPVDPKNPGAGFTDDQVNPNPNSNCIGAACGIDKNASWPKDPKFVPTGCEEIKCEDAAPDDRCDNGSMLVVVSIGKDKNDERAWPNVHLIFRDGLGRNGFRGKQGNAFSPGDQPQLNGTWTHGITDPDAHFKWYHDGTNSVETSRRCFRCKGKMQIDDKGQVR